MNRNVYENSVEAGEHLVFGLALGSRLYRDLLQESLAELAGDERIIFADPYDVQIRRINPFILFDWREWQDSVRRYATGRWQPLFDLQARFIGMNVMEDEVDCLSKLPWRGKIRGLFFLGEDWETIQAGLAAIIRGEVWVPRNLLLQWASADSREDGGNGIQRHNGKLSSRESAVLREIAAGKTNSEIARELYISPNTVKAHLHKIYRKAGVSNRMQAVLWGRRAGLV